MDFTMWKEVAKLIPFAVSQLNFWKFGIARGTYNITLPDWRVKCFPIFALMFYVLAHQNALHSTKTRNMYPRRILFGLASCCLGDYLLTSKETFLQGVGAFALGHIFYIGAYRGKMANKVFASIFVVLMGIFATWYITIPCISTQKDLFYPAMVYKGLLIALAWTVLARLGTKRSKGLDKATYKIQNLGRWFAVLGVLIFVASDMILISSMTCKKIKENHSMEIMSTYYLGQFLISLSTMETFAEDDTENVKTE